jgi:hypothetical protein
VYIEKTLELNKKKPKTFPFMADWAILEVQQKKKKKKRYFIGKSYTFLFFTHTKKQTTLSLF